MQFTVAICTLGKLRIEHELVILSQVWPLGHAREFVVLKGYSIQDARNLAVRDAVMHGSDFVFFYDDDMVPRSPEAMMMLINAITQNPQIGSIAAVYPRRTTVSEPIVEQVQGEGCFWGWEDGGLHECWMTGTGFTIYRLSELEKLSVPEDLIKAADNEDPVPCRRIFEMAAATDDFNFALLARDAGIKQYVHGGVICDQIDLSGKRWMVEDARVKV